MNGKCTPEFHEVLRLNPESFQEATLPGFVQHYPGGVIVCRHCINCASSISLAPEFTEECDAEDL